jgi:TetR/AcrR family transcriptional repressor of mexJK operon
MAKASAVATSADRIGRETPLAPSEREVKPRRAPRLASGGAIREAAAGLFLEKGYQPTSMDDIAAAAQVSKQTIYTHFASKEELFADLVLGNADRAEDFARVAIPAFKAEPDLEAAFRRLARAYINFVIRPEVIRLRRLVIGEAGRFPELARKYYEQVPERVYSGLAELLSELQREGRLSLEDPQLAAQHFAWLLLGWPLDRAMFLRSDAATAEVDLGRLADDAVRVFLAAYRAP